MASAVIWILRTGAPWRDLPPEYGDWKNTNRRFCRCRDKGIWDKLFKLFVQDPDFEWLMIDVSYIKVQWGEQKGLNTKIHLAVDALGMPVKLTVTSGTVADSSQANKPIADINAQYLLADRGYDTNKVVEEGISHRRRTVKKKRRRGIATRYANM